LKVAQWLIFLGENSYDKINIHYIDDWPFERSCENGHLEVAQWLIFLGEKSYGRYTHIEDALTRSRRNDNHKIVQWLISLGEKYGYS